MTVDYSFIINHSSIMINKINTLLEKYPNNYILLDLLEMSKSCQKAEHEFKELSDKGYEVKIKNGTFDLYYTKANNELFTFPEIMALNTNITLKSTAFSIEFYTDSINKSKSETNDEINMLKAEVMRYVRAVDLIVHLFIDNTPDLENTNVGVNMNWVSKYFDE